MRPEGFELPAARFYDARVVMGISGDVLVAEDVARRSESNLLRVRNDRRRLAALERTELLDTEPEESFDRLTRLAARLMSVPATFISLVDGSRDFYKSCFGFGEPLATTRQLEGRTFCHYAIVSEGPLLIDDTMADPVFREVPTVQSLGVRAYAGIPLVTEEGQAIGSFCAIDFAPRKWSPQDVEILSTLAQSGLREIKLRRMAKEAEEQTRLAREATRAHERVLAVVAHDLRTPLNFINLGAQLVADDLSAPENPEMLERMQGAMKSMSVLIEDLLDASKLRDGKLALRKQPWRPAALLEEAMLTLQPLAKRHEIKMEAQAEADLPEVLADHERILRVFSNLIVNALKFSPAGSEIRVKAERSAGAVRFSVIDTGPGIPADQLELLFDPYWQADAKDGRGSGLGLGIARAIVEAHGGTLAVSSAVGSGSDFHFELPLI